MKKVLLGKGNLYKANLHCHSTVSDGRLSPQEIKELYMSKGYSIVAYTDHDVLVDHSDLCDENFLAINGYEYQLITATEKEFRFMPVSHLNLYARDPHNTVQVGFGERESKFTIRHKDKIKYFGEPYPIFRTDYSIQNINHFIRDANEHGFIVCHNHPAWSHESIFDYVSYEGHFAMEIFNSGSMYADPNTASEEWNISAYDELIRRGKRLFPICADDNHNCEDGPYDEAFRGFVEIDSPDLKYENVFSSLENGAFYASTGPKIEKLTVEDGKMHVKCSPAMDIKFLTDARSGKRFAAQDKCGICEAAYEIHDGDGYVRVEVTDFEGHKATTRAYFEDELI